jgi:peptidoglycan/xylan/chitin deacetylase (PgdA/CDA1 family)
LLGPFVWLPAPFSAPLRTGSAALVRAGMRGYLVRRLFWGVRTLEHLRGARAARRSRTAPHVVVLAYHAIAHLEDDPVLARYTVAPEAFAAQLEMLEQHGWRFVDVDALLAAVRDGVALPERAVLLTFDDGYAHLLTTVSPVLSERRIPSVVFAVAGQVGGTNEWDQHHGAGTLELLDADGLRAVTAHGAEIGSHCVSHRWLTRISAEDVESELVRSADVLEALGLPRPRVLAYPFGGWNPSIAETARRCGYAAAFTIDAGAARPGTPLYALPRIQVLASDTPWRLLVRVTAAGWPATARRIVWRALRYV